METKSNKDFSKENMSMTKKDLLNDRGNGEDDVGGGSSKWDVKKKKPGPNGSGSTSVVTRCCQAEKCTSSLAEAKQYHRRHRVCESHAKAQAVVVAAVLTGLTVLTSVPAVLSFPDLVKIASGTNLLLGCG
nr:squamosa promoter-binding-like protein 4 [Tanacetum cinerariifolium]